MWSWCLESLLSKMHEFMRINEMYYGEGREWEYCRVKGKTLKKTKTFKSYQQKNPWGRCTTRERYCRNRGESKREPLTPMLRHNQKRNWESAAYGKMEVLGDSESSSFTEGLVLGVGAYMRCKEVGKRQVLYYTLIHYLLLKGKDHVLSLYSTMTPRNTQRKYQAHSKKLTGPTHLYLIKYCVNVVAG